jgi:hypothetical protein
MARKFFGVLLAVAALSLSGSIAAVADNSQCTSIEAKCAVAAGGKCDRQTGHWCWGISRSGEHCGGSGRAFRVCMARHGISVPVSGIDRPGTPATSGALGKCTTIQARCVVQAGGYCDPRSGHWRIGYVNQHFYGGNGSTFMACLDRARSAQK